MNLIIGGNMQNSAPVSTKHEEWLLFAERDLRAAEILFHAEDVLGMVLFYLNQSIEKSLRAYLVSKNQVPKRENDLVALLEECKAFNKTFAQLNDVVLSLNPYDINTRYPDSTVAMPDLTTAHISLKQVRSIIEFVQKAIVENGD